MYSARDGCVYPKKVLSMIGRTCLHELALNYFLSTTWEFKTNFGVYLVLGEPLKSLKAQCGKSTIHSHDIFNHSFSN